MRILAIETSCDETAIAIVEVLEDQEKTSFSILGNSLNSQIKLHEQYGGVFPMMAKREHARTLIPLLRNALEQARELEELRIKNTEYKEEQIRKLLEREGNLADEFLEFVSKYKKPEIDAIGVTNGPGLEPALWVGINFAKALSLIWNIPLYPINHMEGHILSATLKEEKNNNNQFSIIDLKNPILSLLISGGHTELVLSEKNGDYKVLGTTRDDAVGEAFDKVARMLELPYPGGPQISKLAENARDSGIKNTEIKLPRPMINSDDLDFSFAGLKTAVLYLIKKLPKVDDNTKKEIALEFENAAVEVLISKTCKAILNTNPKILILGGGVSANTHIRREFKKMISEEFPDIELLIPEQTLSTDNAVMIAITTYQKIKSKTPPTTDFIASGNLSF
jgi:N6-L-threonylcarbamoyladenine synthase